MTNYAVLTVHIAEHSMWRADRASSKGARRTGRGSRTIRARGVRGRFRPNSARRPSEDFISCENWKRKKREHSESAAKASPFRSDARRSGLGSSPGIAFRSVRGSQRPSKPGSSEGSVGNAGARLDSPCAPGTPEMRLLGDYRPGSGSDPCHRWQLAQSSLTDGESARAAGMDRPGARTYCPWVPSPPDQEMARHRAQSQGRASEAARMEHRVYFRFEVWESGF